MGCDIHMFIEYRNGDCPWQADPHHIESIKDTCITTSDDTEYCDCCKADDIKNCMYAYRDFRKISATSRDYWLFGLLASVRSCGPREPKGLPNNVSNIIRKAFDDYGNGHSVSYISLEEFKEVLFEASAPDKEGRYTPTEDTRIFYNYEDFADFRSRPPAYTSIVAYGEELKNKYNADKHLLGEDSLSDVEVRLVFWFDS